ncbi:MAG: hypothetical protein L3J33_02960 [Rhodobacteraceae bacterium]|nr:hypothetical protein [Paracoccaceae bacterium]
MSTNKTVENDGDVLTFLEGVENSTRKADALRMLEMMTRGRSFRRQSQY